MRLAVFALVAAMALPAAALAGDHPLDGDWDGVYICAQGKTALTLNLDATPGGKVTGTFRFGPRADNPGAASGSFLVEGTITLDGVLTLNGVSWLVQPADYSMVGLTGRAYRAPDGDALLGDVIPQGPCGRWTAKRRS